jgi:hypothetical protein
MGSGVSWSGISWFSQKSSPHPFGASYFADAPHSGSPIGQVALVKSSSPGVPWEPSGPLSAPAPATGGGAAAGPTSDGGVFAGAKFKMGNDAVSVDAKSSPHGGSVGLSVSNQDGGFSGGMAKSGPSWAAGGSLTTTFP